MFWVRHCQDFAVNADMASSLYYAWDPKNEIKQSSYFVRIQLHMALNSVQKAVQGSIFYCYQIHLIIAVSKVLESVVILKSAISICLSEANLLVLISAFRKLQYCRMMKTAVNQIVTPYDSALGFELNETECEKSTFTARIERQYSTGGYHCCKMSCFVCWEMFSEGVRLTWKPEVSISNLLWSKLNCKGKMVYEFLVMAGFLCVCVCVRACWSSHDTFLA